jgi:hypothetical protein
VAKAIAAIAAADVKAVQDPKQSLSPLDLG